MNIPFIGVEGSDIVWFIEELEARGLNPYRFVNENAAAYACEGYYRTSIHLRHPPFLFLCSATCLYSGTLGIINAKREMSPMLVLLPENREDLEQRRVLNTVTKGVFNKDNIKDAVALSLEPPQGPVAIELNKDDDSGWIDDLRGSEIDFSQRRDMKKQKTQKKIEEIIQKIKRSEMPALLIGRGCFFTSLSMNISAIVESAGIPTAVTLPARGIVDESLDIYLGPVGRRGNPLAAEFLKRCDLIVSVGASLSPLTSEALGGGKTGRIIRIDSHGIDCSDFLKALESVDLDIQPPSTDYIPEIPETETLNTPLAVRTLMENTGDDIFIFDIGSFTVWSAYFGCFTHPWQYIIPYKLYPTGFALGTSAGASIGNTENMRIFAVVGDTGILYNTSDLMTISRYNLPVTIFIFNNSRSDIVWRNYRKHPEIISSGRRPSFSLLAHQFDLEHIEISDRDELLDYLRGHKGDHPEVVELVLDDSRRVAYPSGIPGGGVS